MRNSRRVNHSYHENRVVPAKSYMVLLVTVAATIVIGFVGCKETGIEGPSEKTRAEKTRYGPESLPGQIRPGEPKNTVYEQWPFDAREAKRRQDETAESLRVPVEKRIDFGNGVRMEFILIPAGEFYMGSPGTEKDRHDNEGPIHQVRMSRSFYMSKYEVTQDQYLVVTGVNPSDFKEGTRPVENVPWEDAVAFCKRLSDKHAASFRLPTEAEWEYACRGGTQTRFSYGDDPDYSQLGDYAWYLENSDSTTHSVGCKKPNAFGLYDMHGSVYEWCSDWYAAEQYRQNPAVDPQGPLSGQLRVCRGGSWYHIAGRCRSADRVTIPPDTQDCRIGFRVALDLE